MDGMKRIVLSLSLLSGACLAAWPAVQAGPVSDRVRSTGVLRVCIWPDYYGVTYRHPRTRELKGIDIDLSAELAKDLGARLEYVDSSFPSLVADLTSRRCDVAMSAIAVTPQRQQVLDFTQPYLHSDVYAITTKNNAVVTQWSDIDQPGVRVGVQQGTLTGPIMAAQLQHARVVPVDAPATREQELIAGRVDVFMTNYFYSRQLLDNANWAKLLVPAHSIRVVPYAYAVRPGDGAWLRQMEDFVARIKRDGRLKAAAEKNGLGQVIEP
nr:ABC transporter substrate-binding protein [Acidovorax sp. SUPP2539]